MALKPIAEPLKGTLDVGKGVVDGLVEKEADDGKIDGMEAAQVAGSALVKLIPIWLPFITKAIK